MLTYFILTVSFLASVDVAFMAKDKFKDKGLLAGLSLSFFIAYRLISNAMMALTGVEEPFMWFIGAIGCVIICANVWKKNYRPGMMDEYIDVVRKYMPARSFNASAIDEVFEKMATPHSFTQPEIKHVQEIGDEEFLSLKNG